MLVSDWHIEIVDRQAKAMARIATCCSDSSPVTYSVFICCASLHSVQQCGFRHRVTANQNGASRHHPPPSPRSNSLNPVEKRGSSSRPISRVSGLYHPGATGIAVRRSLRATVGDAARRTRLCVPGMIQAPAPPLPARIIPAFIGKQRRVLSFATVYLVNLCAPAG